jgi:2-haloacid dehalogenase
LVSRTAKIEWITFDCYGTLIDWEEGIITALAPFLPSSADRDELSSRYIKLEAEVEKERYRPYREVLALTSARLLEQMGHPLPSEKQNALPNSLPNWPAFPEVPKALHTLHNAGYRLAILSNVDRDLLGASTTRLGVMPDLLVTAQDCHSYKPAAGHWQHFQDLSGIGPDRTLHVAASLYHDIIPASRLGYRTVFINRNNQPVVGVVPTRVLPDLSGLPEVVTELAEA